jgi:hypothetical protein
MNAGTAALAIAIAFTVLATASALAPSDASRNTGASSRHPVQRPALGEARVDQLVAEDLRRVARLVQNYADDRGECDDRAQPDDHRHASGSGVKAPAAKPAVAREDPGTRGRWDGAERQPEREQRRDGRDERQRARGPEGSAEDPRRRIARRDRPQRRDAGHDDHAGRLRAEASRAASLSPPHARGV